MIDLLKQTVQPKEFNNQFELLPKGNYTVVVESVGDWKPKSNPFLKVFQFDSTGRKVKDQQDKDVFIMETDVTTYSAQVIFEVVEGVFKGAKLYHYLNLHPNQPWALPSYLSACGITEAITPNRVQKETKGALLIVSVDTENKPYIKTNKETGLEETVDKERNVIKRMKAVDLAV